MKPIGIKALAFDCRGGFLAVVQFGILLALSETIARNRLRVPVFRVQELNLPKDRSHPGTHGAKRVASPRNAPCNHLQLQSYESTPLNLT